MRLWAIGCIAALSVRAHRRKTLTPLGVTTAVISSLLYTFHPWAGLLLLLLGFYVTGTFLTKYKHEAKCKLIATSVDGDESASSVTTRTHVQVLANSLAGTILTVVHFYTTQGRFCFGPIPGVRYSSTGFLNDVLVYGIIGHYAAATADTWASEVGVLSKRPPILITTLKVVPPGTNGGVSLIGLLASAAGGLFIGVLSAFAFPLCRNQDIIKQRLVIVGWSTIMGLIGSIIDSTLGAVFQATPYSKAQKKVVELPGGEQAQTTGAISNIGGWNILDNNQVNFAMTFITSFTSMALFAFLCPKYSGHA